MAWLPWPAPTQAADKDTLYVADFSVGSVQKFDLQGNSLGFLVDPALGGLVGPNGIIVNNDEIWIANQNVDLNYNGDIRRYNRQTGTFIDALVPTDDPNGPWAPDGQVLFDHKTLFVADIGDLDTDTGVERQGKLLAFDAKTGALLGNLAPPPSLAAFHPRGLVIGPDERLYVSVRFLASPLGGAVLRYDPETLEYVDTFISDTTCQCDLNRPDGLVFGPDRRLYLTSFRANVEDNDKILIFNGRNGTFKGQIDLATPVTAAGTGGPRAFAQSLLFGPKGKLYVPITGGGPDAGSVRVYNVKTKTFKEFIPPATYMAAPRYLTFGKTDPGTLAYKD